MKGSVRKRGTTWSYRIDFGKTPDGKRNQIEKGGYKTKKEADKALNDVLFQFNNTGDYIENKKIYFQDVYKEFMSTEAPATRAYATLKRYDSLYRNHYKDVFDGFYMYQITSNMINDFISEKLQNYSEEYTKGLYKTLRVLFCFAHSRKYLKKNPFDDVTPPPDPRHIGDIRHYEPSEIALMGERLKGTNVKVSFYIALNTGLRESEVFGLQWSDSDAGLYVSVYPQRIDGVSLSSSNVLYYEEDDKGRITKLILKNVTGDMLKYGIMIKAQNISEEDYMAGTYKYDLGGTVYDIETTDRLYTSVSTGTPIKVVLENEEVKSLQSLSIINGSVSSLSYTAAKIGGNTYPVSSDVCVYVKNYYGTYLIMNFSDLINNLDKYSISAYYDKSAKSGGCIRVFVVREK